MMEQPIMLKNVTGSSPIHNHPEHASFAGAEPSLRMQSDEPAAVSQSSAHACWGRYEHAVNVQP